jgi:hypothetical protein
MARDTKLGEAIDSPNACNKVRLTTGMTMTWDPAKKASLTELVEWKYDSVFPTRAAAF